MDNLPDWFTQCMECEHAYEDPDNAGEYLCKIEECSFEPYKTYKPYKRHVKDSTELNGGTLW